MAGLVNYGSSDEEDGIEEVIAEVMLLCARVEVWFTDCTDSRSQTIQRPTAMAHILVYLLPNTTNVRG